ncbi:MAG: hypothetical protein M0Q44_22155 [Methylobacter sp.]|jgi:hypothetical protein|nr:hypothetical protein [Methylobacter sp.]
MPGVPVCRAVVPETPIFAFVQTGLFRPTGLIHEHLNAAQRVRFLRCLRQQQAESYWRQWRKQALHAGQLIFNIGK